MNEKSDQSNKFLPIWVWIVALVQILLVLFFSVGTALSPADFIPDVAELTYVTQLYITRNVTIAVGMIVALLLKSHKGLLTVLVVRVLTDVADVITVYVLDVDEIKSSVPMVVILLIIPASLAIAYLWRRKI